MDCCVKARASKDREGSTLLRQAVILGWNGLCWNHSIFGRAIQASISPIALHRFELSAMDAREVEKERLIVDSDAVGACERFTQLHRLSITLDDFAEAQSLQPGNEHLKKFDLIAAILSNNPKVFQYLCREADIDIIAFDFSRPLGFALNKKLIDEAVGRGIYFEVKYSPLLVEGGSRKEVMTGAKQLVRVLRGRNIILSSGAETGNQLRGVHDAINIGRLLNMTLEQSRSAVYDNWKKVIAHGELRKRQRLPMQIATADQVQDILAKKRKLKSKDSGESKLTKKQRRRLKQLENSGHDDDQPEEMNDDIGQQHEQEDGDSGQLAIFD